MTGPGLCSIYKQLCGKEGYIETSFFQKGKTVKKDKSTSHLWTSDRMFGMNSSTQQKPPVQFLNAVFLACHLRLLFQIILGDRSQFRSKNSKLQEVTFCFQRKKIIDVTKTYHLQKTFSSSGTSSVDERPYSSRAASNFR